MKLLSIFTIFTFSLLYADLNQDLIEAAKSGELVEVEKLLDDGADVDAVGSSIEFPSSCLFVVDSLGDIGERGECRTPLMFAAEGGFFPVVQHLMRRNASVDARDEERRTPLMFAVRSGSVEVTRCLVDEKASVHDKDVDGRTALSYAAEYGHFDVVEFLIERGADVNVADEWGWTPLRWAVNHGCLSVVHHLIIKGAQIVTMDHKDLTALDEARKKEKPQLIALLSLCEQPGFEMFRKDPDAFVAQYPDKEWIALWAIVLNRSDIFERFHSTSYDKGPSRMSSFMYAGMLDRRDILRKIVDLKKK